MKAKDIMKEHVITIRENVSLKKAARVMITNGISGVPVVDAKNRLVGILSEGDLVRQQKPMSKPMILMFLDAALPLNYREMNEDLEAITATEVSQLMSQPVKTLTPEDSLSRVAELMLKDRINRVPIVDTEGFLVGIVTRQDIVRAIYLADEDLPQEGVEGADAPTDHGMF